MVTRSFFEGPWTKTWNLCQWYDLSPWLCPQFYSSSSSHGFFGSNRRRQTCLFQEGYSLYQDCCWLSSNRRTEIHCLLCRDVQWNDLQNCPVVRLEERLIRIKPCWCFWGNSTWSSSSHWNISWTQITICCIWYYYSSVWSLLLQVSSWNMCPMHSWPILWVGSDSRRMQTVFLRVSHCPCWVIRRVCLSRETALPLMWWRAE